MANISQIDPKGLSRNPASSQAKESGKILNESGKQTFRVWMDEIKRLLAEGA